MKNMITPAGEWTKYNEKEKRPMKAELVKSCGSWFLFWEDGTRTDLQKSSAPIENHGHSREEIIHMVVVIGRWQAVIPWTRGAFNNERLKKLAEENPPPQSYFEENLEEI